MSQQDERRPLQELSESFVLLTDAIWELTLADHPASARADRSRRDFLFDRDYLISFLTRALAERMSEDLVKEVLSLALSTPLFKTVSPQRKTNQRIRCSLETTNPVILSTAALTRNARADDIRYFVVRELRRKHALSLSSELGDAFRYLCHAINDSDLLSSASRRLGASGAPLVLRQRKDAFLYVDLVNYLKEALTSHFAGSGSEQQSANYLGLFLDACRLANYLRPHFEPGKVYFITRQLDAEFLISSLFGFPSGISGFDELFGAGGVILGDNAVPSRPGDIRARTVLTVGRFGTGKTVLACQLAASIARKGGVVWIANFEQTIEEYLFVLRSIAGAGDDTSVRILSRADEVAHALNEPGGPKSVIILLSAVATSYDAFLKQFTDRLNQIDRTEFRCLIIDSVNAVGSEGGAPPDARLRAVQAFNIAKRNGTNVWLIAEEGLERELNYWNNIADTVLCLTAKERGDTSFRFIEVMKSRLQREQPGKHTFVILPDQGVSVTPSPAAVRRRLSARTLFQRNRAVRFGQVDFDKVIGEKGLRIGDLVVVTGPASTFKTQVGLCFLAETDQENAEDCVALLIALRETESAASEHLQTTFRAYGHRPQWTRNRVRIVSVPHGNITLGEVLQLIERAIVATQREGKIVDRVMVDDVHFVGLSTSPAGLDMRFADALIDLFSRYRTTTLMSCGSGSGEYWSTVQRTLVESADVLIETSRVTLQGTPRVMYRVSKTSSKGHSPDPFELRWEGGQLVVNPSFSLLRFGSDGTATSIPISLYMHSENPAQSAYNSRIERILQSALSTKVNLQTDVLQTDGTEALSKWSVGDELRILQLDEFQLHPMPRRDSNWLRELPSPGWPFSSQVVEDLGKRCRTENGFIAVPYFVNVGLLVYRSSIATKWDSWREIADEAAKWRKDHVGEDGIFFDFAKGTGENLNCLFFEILSSLSLPSSSDVQACVLSRWLRSQAAHDAIEIFYKLCADGWRLSRGRSGSTSNRQAVVWRHWYTTLADFVGNLSTDVLDDLAVSYVPGPGVAGEWYLGIAKDSAAADVAVQGLRFLCKGTEEMERLRTGVGLPTRAGFYESETGNGLTTYVGPSLQLRLKNMQERIHNSFRRSSIGCYQEVSQLLTDHLIWILERSDGRGNQAKLLWQDLLSSLSLLESEERCQSCRVGVGGIHASSRRATDALVKLP
jgi:KaiC/GvpD/RAD55 family RecA-like ATPase